MLQAIVTESIAKSCESKCFQRAYDSEKNNMLKNLISRLFPTQDRQAQQEEKPAAKPTPENSTAKIPKYSGKVSLDKMEGIETYEYTNKFEILDREVLYTKNESLPFKMLWRPQDKADRIFVFFSGDAQRKKNNPPVFQRWSWASKMPGHCLYISDPSLYLNDTIGLAWYAGTKEIDTPQVIAYFLSQLSKDSGIPLSKFVLYGSSGGGFAALKVATFLDDVCVIPINPQTNILSYNQFSVEKYLRDAWNIPSRKEAQETIANRVSVLSSEDVLSLAKNPIIYIQNTYDEHHFSEHFLPFIEKINVLKTGSNLEYLSVLLFSEKGGHSKAESQNVFDRAMKLLP